MIDTVLYVGLVVLIVVTLGCVYRAWRGPTIIDRLLAIDLISTLLMSIIILLALAWDAGYLIDIAMAMAAISFIGTLGVARYVREKEIF